MKGTIACAALAALGLLAACSSDETSSTAGTTTSTTGAGGATTTTGAGGSTATTGAGGSTTSTTTTTGAGGSGGGGGSVPGAACDACVESEMVFAGGSQCAAKLSACNDDTDCAAWLMCTRHCSDTDFTTECYAACDQAESAVANLYQPVYDCVCPVCQADCAPACPQ